MVTKKLSMYMLTDLAMTRLFQLAEYVCNKSQFLAGKSTLPLVTESAVPPAVPAATQESAPTIRLSDQDRMVEGELFK